MSLRLSQFIFDDFSIGKVINADFSFGIVNRFFVFFCIGYVIVDLDLFYRSTESFGYNNFSMYCPLRFSLKLVSFILKCVDVEDGVIWHMVKCLKCFASLSLSFSLYRIIDIFQKNIRIHKLID